MSFGFLVHGLKAVSLSRYGTSSGSTILLSQCITRITCSHEGSKRFYRRMNFDWSEKKPRFSFQRDDVPQDYALIFQNDNEWYIRSLALIVPVSFVIYALLGKMSIEFYKGKDKKPTPLEENMHDGSLEHGTLEIGNKTESLEEAWDSDDIGMLNEPNPSNTPRTKKEIKAAKKKARRLRMLNADKNNIRTIAIVGIVHSIIVAGLIAVYRSSVFRIYRHCEFPKYIAIRPKWFFFNKQVKFKLGDVHNITGLQFFWYNFLIKGRRCSLSSDHFKLPVYYNEFMEGSD